MTVTCLPCSASSVNYSSEKNPKAPSLERYAIIYSKTPEQTKIATQATTLGTLRTYSDEEDFSVTITFSVSVDEVFLIPQGYNKSKSRKALRYIITLLGKTHIHKLWFVGESCVIKHSDASSSKHIQRIDPQRHAYSFPLSFYL
ncbi:MAG: hypothetical protein AAGI90_04610 [Chlamydiota bacterium]